MDVCPNATRAFNQFGQVIHIACDSWQCDTCRQVLAWQWSRHIYYGWCLWRPRPFYFWTLTMPGWMIDPKMGYRELQPRWDTFRKRINRHAKWFVYAAFVEEQHEERDMPHLHIITLTNCPGRLKDIAAECGFGYEAKDLLMSGPAAAYYVSKYASKELTYAPRNFRRVRISHIWPRLPDPIYPYEVYPMQRGELFSAYLSRVSDKTGHGFEALRLIWSHREEDVV